ncbi:hypothetical protein C435_17792 [Haloarcula marismortui ATCC 33799]|uniref:Uncharacterized protein n=1 Tax=Haloarcula marismortui ATCC 33799 TaxID=662475 RepID=M0JVZ5_9EURY|nr:hypothetical protein C435_17792 [Haloarcula californiae ATCC 33799]
MKQFVHLWIGGVLPELLVGDVNHCFVKRDLIRRSPKFGLWIGFLHPIMDGFATTLDTHILEQFGGIRQ